MQGDEHVLIERIHASGKQLVLAVTGGGSGALAALLEVPGASATVLEGVVPYSAAALETWLGGRPDQAASERTARAMAMAAFERARSMSDANPRMLRGIGATASLVTTRPKRGAHRVHVAWQSADTTVVTSCELSKDNRTRAQEEQIATQLVLSAVAEACAVDTASGEQGVGTAPCTELQRREQHAPPEWTALLLGERQSVAIADSSTIANPQSARSLPAAAGNAKFQILFPGAFNPIHAAHEQIAAYAAAHYGAPVTWELSIANVDKPPLDFIEIADRLAGLAGRRVLLSRAATFVEKAALVPGCLFLIGADTIERIADPRYYGGDAVHRDGAVAAIASHGCRFLVFGRLFDDRFRTLSEVELPPALRQLCDEVPESEFRHDAASKQIRAEVRSDTGRG
ncbi:MAG: CinA family protein [Pirellulales bacterium]